MTAAPPLSGWCSMPPGITNHTSAHRVCQMRLDSGHIAACGCPDHPKKKDAA